MYGMNRQNRLARKIDFVPKNTSKTAIFVCKNWSYLALEGPGRQTGLNCILQDLFRDTQLDLI